MSFRFAVRILNLIGFLSLFAFTILTQSVSPQIYFTPPNQTSIYMFSNQTYNTDFFLQTYPFDCSLSSIYTYRQTPMQLNQNSLYYINISQINFPVNITITSIHSVITPTFNQTFCQQNQSCTISIQNNCPNPVSMFKYYDRIQVSITAFTTMTYYVICDSEYSTNTFEWGIVIQIIICTIIISLTAIYSRAWSIQGNGIALNIYIIVVFIVLVIIAGVIGYLSMEALNVIAVVLTFILGIIGVGLCTMQCIFLLRIKFLMNGLIDFKLFKLNLMHIISFLVGLGITIGWWLSGKNWIINDIIFFCLVIAVIKIFKFTTFQMAVICFSIFIIIELIFVILIQYAFKQSYNNVLLNLLNAPFELQLPTLNPVYNQKCAWLPITAIIYPGMFMAYLRRFDTSRNTIIYLTISIIVFVIGSFISLVVSLFTPFALPFGLITEPINIILVIIFAYKRSQIRTVWDGLFYDEQFANKESIKALKKNLQYQGRVTQMSMANRSFLKNLKINAENSLVDSVQIKQNLPPI